MCKKDREHVLPHAIHFEKFYKWAEHGFVTTDLLHKDIPWNKNKLTLP